METGLVPSLVVLCVFSAGYCIRLPFSNTAREATELIDQNLTSFNDSYLDEFTYTVVRKNLSSPGVELSDTNVPSETEQVDCLGLGKTIAKALGWFFMSKPNGTNALDVQFFFSSRQQRQRVKVPIGEQFGLEWTDFKIERRTVFIVHGFLSNGQESWVADLEKAFLDWGDVNVIVVDWSAGSNTWNYYKAAVNTRIVGYQISKLLEHITNATRNATQSGRKTVGPLHLVGHSLGAHICGFASKELKKRNSEWMVKRITGLDPAQPCFRNADPSVLLHKTDAPLVDIIHTNGRLLSDIGLGLPHAIGHIDFYPNGGKVQPGCRKGKSALYDIPVPPSMIQQAICSHGRSYVYLTESLVSATNGNCSFWAHHWDLSPNNLKQLVSEPCNKEVCTEMGIKAENYPHRGIFFAATGSSPPFCGGNSTDFEEETKHELEPGLSDDLRDYVLALNEK